MDQQTAPAIPVLIVDDDIDALRLMGRILETSGYSVDLAQNGEEAMAKVSAALPHIILLDINMPGLSGIDILRQLRRIPQYIPVILVTAKTDVKDVVTGLEAGADDYIRKPFNRFELVARVRTQLRMKELNDKLAEANKKLAELAEIDDLTKLYNTRNIFQKIDTEISRARRYDRTMAVIMLDLDDFKNINDKHDHVFGSYVLAQMGALIASGIRKEDFAVRYGGDEFLIVLTETTFSGAEKFTARLTKAITDRIFSDGRHTAQVTISLGCALTDFIKTPDMDAQGLIRLADNALYRAKREGKNCIRMA